MKVLEEKTEMVTNSRGHRVERTTTITEMTTEEALAELLRGPSQGSVVVYQTGFVSRMVTILRVAWWALRSRVRWWWRS